MEARDPMGAMDPSQLPPLPPELSAALQAMNPLVRGLVEPWLLPLLDALAALQAQARAQQVELGELREQLAAERAKVKDLEAMLAVKQHRIDQLERQLFGQKSERIKTTDPRRAAKQARRRARSEEDKAARRKAEQAKRKALLEKLATTTVVVPLPPDACCPHCHKTDLRLLPQGEQSVRYEWRPGTLERIVYDRQKGVCDCGHGIVTAPAPDQVIEGGQYGPGLHAHTVVSKVMDALPFHRQARAFERLRIPVGVTQLCAMFHRSAELVEPVYNALVARLPECRYVQADETTQPVLEPGKVRKGWMWTFLDTRSIVFVYDPSRGGKTPARILGTSPGVLTVDGYTGYNKVTTPEGRKRAGCWSHARRELIGARATAPLLVDELLGMIHDLFVVEQEAIEEGLVGTAAHQALRQTQSRPLVDRIFLRMEAWSGEFSPGSVLSKALSYALNQRAALSLFLTDPNIPLHNNASESALRIVALLRKNALFVGHDEGGHHLAIHLTVCGTCRLHGVDPQRWYTDALIRVGQRGSTVGELLPWVWKEGRGRPPPAEPDP